MSEDVRKESCDILIVGAGGAGLRAAIAAADADMSVSVVSKSLLGKAHTVMAEGGIAASLGHADSRDNWKVHFRDTMRGGKNLSNWEMAKIHAEDAPKRVRELETWGAVFDRTEDGRINQRNFGGHRYPRLAHVGDRTGLEIIRTLQDHAVHKQNINMFMEYTVSRLFKKNGKAVGAMAYDRATGEIVLFESKAVILATGGIGKAYRITSNSWEYTGDGHSLAYLMGADLIDMEFVQFHPTGMVWPPSVKGTLVTEGVRGEGGILVNSDGERFMFNYIPEVFAAETAKDEDEANDWLDGKEGAMRPPELLTRDVVARAIMNEVKEGRGSPHGGVFLDIASRRSPDYIKKKLPSMYHQFKELAVLDITTTRMEVGPTTHYMMGGVKVDATTGSSTIDGLFAAGEAAAGMHGANRLGGNSLSDLLVFGKLAGQAASNHASSIDFTSPEPNDVQNALDDLLRPLNGEEGFSPYKLQEELQEIMEQNVGIVRTEEGLQNGIDELNALSKKLTNLRTTGSRKYNPGWHLCLDLHNMVIASKAVASAALERTESRGAHTRLDYPNYDDVFETLNIIIRKSPDSMSVVRAPLTKMPSDLSDFVQKEAV